MHIFKFMPPLYHVRKSTSENTLIVLSALKKNCRMIEWMERGNTAKKQNNVIFIVGHL